MTGWPEKNVYSSWPAQVLSTRLKSSNFFPVPDSVILALGTKSFKIFQSLFSNVRKYTTAKCSEAFFSSVDNFQYLVPFTSTTKTILTLDIFCAGLWIFNLLGNFFLLRGKLYSFSFWSASSCAILLFSFYLVLLVC